MSGLPQPLLHKDAKFVFLSDWDGTITDRDSNDFLIDNLGFGEVKRRELNIDVLNGTAHFRDAFRQMLDSIDAPFEECKRVLRETPKSYEFRDITLDPGFETFYRWCKARGIPLIIVSSGMAPIIRAVLEKLVGVEQASEIEIIANDVKFTDPEGKGDTWEIVFRHPESGFGHDKSRSIIPYRDIPGGPTLFFAGDGVSDLSAARHADLLFTKVLPGGNTELLAYCKREGIPHVRFSSFDTVQKDVAEVVEGRKDPAQVVAEAAAQEMGHE